MTQVEVEVHHTEPSKTFLACNMTPRYPSVTANPNRKFGWILQEDVRVRLSDGKQLLIPKRYAFDGSSIPRVLWSFLPPHGADIYGALVHDYIFTLKQSGYDGFTRSFADNEYLRLCLSPYYRTGLIRPYILYLGVRSFSWLFWRVII